MSREWVSQFNSSEPPMRELNKAAQIGDTEPVRRVSSFLFNSPNKVIHAYTVILTVCSDKLLVKLFMNITISCAV